MKPRIIVEISGGVCVAVYADQPVNVSVLDHDNMKSGDMTDDEIQRWRNLEAEAADLTAYL